MDTTPVSLLEQLRQPESHTAWDRFVALYTPLLHRWAHGLHLATDQADDLVQDVFVILVKQMPRFRYDPKSSFRAWLKTVLMNRSRERLRKRTEINQPHDADPMQEPSVPDDAEVFAEREYRQHLLRRALELMRSEFPPASWQACWATTVEGQAAHDVARELGMTVTSVWTAKSRVLRRLREELKGLLD
jgi:RNA polymerase sigma-70 factor (ECF subfamily)